MKCLGCDGQLSSEYDLGILKHLEDDLHTSTLRRIQSGYCWVCKHLQAAVIRESQNINESNTKNNSTSD